MALADLHVHSRYSKSPDQWFMNRIGTQESYTEIEEVYTIAKNRGMDFVTISDHNAIEGALRLVEYSPYDTFVSVEVTAYFPENGCKIHVLVFDLTERQFQEIDRIRTNIYDLRDYLKQEDLANSVGHATYGINRKLSFEILEKLMLLFDVFEGINGSRHSSYNLIWQQALVNLRPEDIDRLYQKHRIDPFSESPWIKGFTGGSDDHAGLFIGQTYTVAEAHTVSEYLRQIKAKQTISDGRSSDFKTVAFAFYKVACDFSNSSPTSKKSNGLLGLVNGMLFENKRPGIRSRLAMKVMSRRKSEKEKVITRVLSDLITDFVSNGRLSIDEKIDKIYDGIAAMTDNFLTMILESMEKDFKTGDIPALISNFSAILPAMFLSAPFFSTLKYLSMERNLATRLKTEFIDTHKISEKRTLWFSDTVDNLEKFATIIQDFLHRSGGGIPSVKLVLSSPVTKRYSVRTFPFKTLYLPTIYEYTPESYSFYTMRVASLLKSIEMIHEENPDEIIISSPGPIGLIGVIAGKLLGVPIIGIHYADYAESANSAMNETLLNPPLEMYTRWFYSLLDEIYVPSEEHIALLEDRGFKTSKMKTLLGEEEPETHLANLASSFCAS